MPVLSCKMCGGDLRIIKGEAFAVCESCGTKQTYPHIDEDEIQERYNLANYERRNNNFDTAFSIYSDLAISSRGNEPEAYWNTMLCRFGIVYQLDKATRREIPTINRTQQRSVYDDPGYKKAIEYADPEIRLYYEQEAEKIEKIRTKYLNIISKEEKYDVFICFKETDGAGRRTKDSVEAQLLYDYLTKDGYKVFFSRVTLRDLAGIDYEPYIYAALNSAKVMFVFGTKSEYVNAPWVKNEWTRYLKIIEDDFEKIIIPIIDNDPSVLPNELIRRQAFRISDPGWYQDAKSRVERSVGRKKQEVPVSVVKNDNPVEQIVKNAETFIKLNNKEEAFRLYEGMTKNYPDDYRGWWNVVKIRTKDFTDTRLMREDKANLITFAKNAYILANETQQKQIEKTWSRYLRECSEYDSDQSLCGQEVVKITKQVEDLQTAVQKLKDQNSTLKADIDKLYDDREKGKNKPDLLVQEQIQEKEKEVRNTTPVFSLIRGGIIIGLIVLVFRLLQIESPIIGAALLAIGGIIGFSVGAVPGAVVGVLITYVGGEFLAPVLKSSTTMYVIVAIVALMIAASIYSGYKSKRRMKIEIQKMEKEKTEMGEKIQAWYQSFDQKANDLRDKIDKNNSVIQELDDYISQWQDWGWYEEDEKRIPRKSEFETFVYQKMKAESGMHVEPNEFVKLYNELCSRKLSKLQ